MAPTEPITSVHRFGGSGADSGVRPRRIAAIIPARDISGPGRQLVAQARSMIRQGIDVQVIVPLRPGTQSSFPRFAADNGVPCHVLSDRGIVDTALVRELHRLLRDLRPDLVQTHAYKATGLMYVLRKLGLRMPWIGFFHGATDLGLRDRMFHRLDLRMLRAADRIVVMSGRQAAMFGDACDRVNVVHNAVLDAEGGGRNGARVRRAAGIEFVPVIGVIGRLSREKGVDLLLQALAKLSARQAHWRAEIAGDGPELVRLQADCDQLGLGNRVRFRGQVHDIASVYKELDLVVIPSRSEGLPNVLLEAMRYDIPVVATNVGAIPDILAAVPGAFRLVPPENTSALSDAIAEALGDLNSEDAARARIGVADRFSLEGRVDVLMALYTDMLGKRERKGAR